MDSSKQLFADAFQTIEWINKLVKIALNKSDYGLRWTTSTKWHNSLNWIWNKEKKDSMYSYWYGHVWYWLFKCFRQKEDEKFFVHVYSGDPLARLADDLQVTE